MTTELEGGEGSSSRPGRSSPPEKTRYPLYIHNMYFSPNNTGVTSRWIGNSCGRNWDKYRENVNQSTLWGNLEVRQASRKTFL